jgi:hypothetical protein
MMRLMKTQISITNIKPKNNSGDTMPENEEVNEQVEQSEVKQNEVEQDDDGVEEELIDEESPEDMPDPEDEVAGDDAQE